MITRTWLETQSSPLERCLRAAARGWMHLSHFRAGHQWQRGQGQHRRSGLLRSRHPGSGQIETDMFAHMISEEIKVGQISERVKQSS